MDWIARLEEKKKGIRTEIDPTKPTEFDFNRVRIEKNNDTHKNRPYKTYKTNVADPLPEDVYPIPMDEKAFAEEERQAIIEVDGGQGIPYSGPVEVKMDSAILGDAVEVILEPDQATVDGVVYSNAELVDLLSRGLNRDKIRDTHEVKRTFEGKVTRYRVKGEI